METQTLIDVLERMAESEIVVRKEMLQAAAARLREQEKRISELREQLRCTDAQVRLYMDGHY